MLDEDFQMLIRHHPEMKPLYYRVSGSPGKRAHWRIKGKDYLDCKLRSEGKKKSQVAFGEITLRSFGKKMSKEGLPPAAVDVRIGMKGKKFVKKVPRWQREVEKAKELEAVV